MGWFAAILSGILAGFSYPTVLGGKLLPDLGFLAFFAWVPLFQALSHVSPRRAFALSFVAGFFQYIFSMYWLYTAMHSFGGLGSGLSVFVLILLAIILATEFGIIFYLSQWLNNRLKMPIYWIRPFVWIAIEFARGHIPAGGFPWSQIGYSQGAFLYFIQISDLVGVYGVTFLLVVFNEAFSQILIFLRSQKNRESLKPLLFSMLLFLSVFTYGYYRLHHVVTPREEKTMGIVQGNIDQADKWDPAEAQNIAKIYQSETEKLAAQSVDWVIWPEAAWPFDLPVEHKTLFYPKLSQPVNLLFGAVTRPAKFYAKPEEVPYQNSALILDKQGRVSDYYHKAHLVPFGEYVPWRKWLSFAKKMTAQIGDLVPGDSFRPMKSGRNLLGVLICYEDIFPEIARTMVAEGADVLVNISNDAWYGRSSAPYQHQVFSQFRSIETRRDIIRATNTGLSSMIDRYGRVLWQGELFEKQSFVSKISLYEDKSIYVRIGDSFCYLTIFVVGLMTLLAIFKRRSSGA